MAKTVFTGAWTDTAPQTVHIGRTRVTAIEVMKNKAQSATVYLQLYDALVGSVTPGVTAPHFAIPIDSITRDSKQKVKILIPGGGIILTTGLAAFNSTTGSGGTAPTTTAIVDSITVYHTPGN